jgi:hypothetical protein
VLKVDNKVLITIRDGETGDVKFQTTEHNDIADDFLCGRGVIFANNIQNDSTRPFCFLLPDGGSWSGFVFDPANPSAPYCIQPNNYNHLGAQVDALADQTFKTHSGAVGIGGGLQPPYGQSGGLDNSTQGKWKLFFRWTALPTDFTLRAIGLTGWQTNNQDFIFGGEAAPAVFVPDTLVVLPSGILVKGRNAGAQTPDTLEVSYFLSIVGA